MQIIITCKGQLYTYKYYRHVARTSEGRWVLESNGERPRFTNWDRCDHLLKHHHHHHSHHHHDHHNHSCHHDHPHINMAQATAQQWLIMDLE